MTKFLKHAIAGLMVAGGYYSLMYGGDMLINNNLLFSNSAVLAIDLVESVGAGLMAIGAVSTISMINRSNFNFLNKLNAIIIGTMTLATTALQAFDRLMFKGFLKEANQDAAQGNRETIITLRENALFGLRGVMPVALAIGAVGTVVGASLAIYNRIKDAGSGEVDQRTATSPALVSRNKRARAGSGVDQGTAMTPAPGKGGAALSAPSTTAVAGKGVDQGTAMTPAPGKGGAALSALPTPAIAGMFMNQGTAMTPAPVKRGAAARGLPVRGVSIAASTLVSGGGKSSYGSVVADQGSPGGALSMSDIGGGAGSPMHQSPAVAVPRTAARARSTAKPRAIPAVPSSSVVPAAAANYMPLPGGTGLMSPGGHPHTVKKAIGLGGIVLGEMSTTERGGRMLRGTSLAKSGVGVGVAAKRY
jgi:hypothetical protein